MKNLYQQKNNILNKFLYLEVPSQTNETTESIKQETESSLDDLKKLILENNNHEELSPSEKISTQHLNNEISAMEYKFPNQGETQASQQKSFTEYVIKIANEQGLKFIPEDFFQNFVSKYEPKLLNKNETIPFFVSHPNLEQDSFSNSIKNAMIDAKKFVEAKYAE